MRKKNQNILFVESDPVIQGTFKARLEQADHVVTLASSGDEAIELMHKHVNAYNLIIVDLHLLGSKNGVDVIQEGYLFQVKCKFWMVSASLNNEEADQAKQSGAIRAFNKSELDRTLQLEGYTK